MSKARELAELGAVYDSGALSNRNLIINGAMTLAQRGTSVTGITGSGYQTLDRFKTSGSAGGTWTMAQTAITDLAQFAQSLKMDVTTAKSSPDSGSSFRIQTLLEGQDLQRFAKGTSSAKEYSLSFYVKGTTTGTYIVEFYDADNTRHVSKAYTIDAANTWEYKTLLFPADTTGAFDNDNANSLIISWYLMAGSDLTSGTLQQTWGAASNTTRASGQVNLAASTSNDWQITGVQLEVGSEATPFEHRSFGDELHRCQRYFEVIVSGDSREIGGGNYYSSSSIHCPTIFETSKRTNSYSVTVTGGTNYFRVYRNGTSDDFDGFTGSTRANINRCLLYASSGVSGTAGHGLELLTNNASAKVVVDDEL
tara:strand:- start:1680 stop:2777 length:1098 start_codon:yes stop_codon:yes gene_type:complete